MSDSGSCSHRIICWYFAFFATLTAHKLNVDETSVLVFICHTSLKRVLSDVILTFSCLPPPIWLWIFVNQIFSRCLYTIIRTRCVLQPTSRQHKCVYCGINEVLLIGYSLCRVHYSMPVRSSLKVELIHRAAALFHVTLLVGTDNRPFMLMSYRAPCGTAENALALALPVALWQVFEEEFVFTCLLGVCFGPKTSRYKESVKTTWMWWWMCAAYIQDRSIRADLG